MDAKFINPVLKSIINVLSTMAQVSPVPGKPSLKTDDRSLGVVTGIIAMNSPQANGSLAISFSEAAILDITRRMLRVEANGIDDMVKDLTGEISNMVLGGAKSLLEQDGYDFDLTLPEVLAGEHHTIKHPVQGSKIVLPFSTEAGPFFVEICFQD